jgi:hypothetical protein
MKLAAQTKPKIKFSRKRGLAKQEEFIRVVTQLADAIGIDIEIEGTERIRQSAGGGIYAKIPGGTTGNTDPTPIWGIRSDYKIAPGTVGGLVPTYSGVSLSPVGSATAVPSSGSGTLYFKLTFSLTKDSNGFVTAQSLSSVEVVTTSGSNTEDIKYLAFQTRTSGVYGSPMYSSSLNVSLCNTAANTTTLTVTAV